MSDFSQLIGEKIIAIYLEPTAIELGVDNTQYFKDFIFVGSGLIQIRTELNLYTIGSLHSTRLATDYLGIEKRNDLLKESENWQLRSNDLDFFLNKTINSITLFWNKEEWTNYKHNEKYIESLKINFIGGESLSAFCGDFEMNSSRHFNFLAGRSSLILFYNEIVFDNYKLNHVLEEQKLTSN